MDVLEIGGVVRDELEVMDQCNGIKQKCFIALTMRPRVVKVDELGVRRIKWKSRTIKRARLSAGHRSVSNSLTENEP